MIDQRLVLSHGMITQFFQHAANLRANFGVIFNVVQGHMSFLCDTKLQSVVEIINERLHSGWINAKVSRNVAAEYSCFQCLDMSAHIRLRLQNVSLIRIVDRVHMPVRHENTTLVRLHHEQCFTQRAGTFSKYLIWVQGNDIAQ